MTKDEISCLVYGVADELGLLFDSGRKNIVYKIPEELYYFVEQLVEDGVLKWHTVYAHSVGERSRYYTGTDTHEVEFTFKTVDFADEPAHEVALYTVECDDADPSATGVLTRKYTNFVPSFGRVAQDAENTVYMLHYPSNIVHDISVDGLKAGQTISDKSKIPTVVASATFFNKSGMERLACRMEALAEAAGIKSA